MRSPSRSNDLPLLRRTGRDLPALLRRTRPGHSLPRGGLLRASRFRRGFFPGRSRTGRGLLLRLRPGRRRSFESDLASRVGPLEVEVLSHAVGPLLRGGLRGDRAVQPGAGRVVGAIAPRGLVVVRVDVALLAHPSAFRSTGEFPRGGAPGL